MIVLEGQVTHKYTHYTKQKRKKEKASGKRKLIMPVFNNGKLKKV